MIQALTPKHLWSNESKYKKSWILFNSDDINLDIENMQRTSRPSIDTVQAKEVDEYFKAYAITNKHFLHNTQSHDSFVSMKSCFCDSTQSIFSEKFKTSLIIKQMECETCKNLILRGGNRRCSLCVDCLEKFYSPKTCATCHGRISFQDLKSSSSQLVNKKQFNENFNESSLKLCNCFPKYPSQNLSSLQSTNANDVQILPQILGKACSYSELMMMQQKKKSSQSFYSQNCLPLNSNDSDGDSSSSGEE
jgi:hypothetical protein